MSDTDVVKMIERLKTVYTQKEIAKLVGVSAMTITSWKKRWFEPKANRKEILETLYNACKE